MEEMSVFEIIALSILILGAFFGPPIADIIAGNIEAKEKVKKEETNPIKSLTLGKRDDNGFCETYINGEKSNIKLLVFTEEEIKRLDNISNKIYKEKDGRTK